MDQAALQEIKANITKELEDASSGQQTSFMFIKNQLPDHPFLQVGETMQTIVAGGTIFRTALVTKKDQELEVHDIEEKTHGLFPTKESFFDYLVSNLDPEVKFLAINMAHELEPFFRDGILDGKLLTAAKGHKFEGLLGYPVGEEFEKYVKAKLGRDIKVSIANDTICLMLSGLTQYPAENLAAGIVGTGMNFAIFLDATHAINLAAAQFDKFPISKEVEAIDKASGQIHFHLFEKAVAGAFLFEQFNLKLQEKGNSYPPLTETAQLDQIIRNNTSEVVDLAKEVLYDSAKMVAAMIAGITTFYKKDVTFVMQGSLFWKGIDYKETVEATLKEILPEYNVNFAFVENADYLGAAKLIA